MPGPASEIEEVLAACLDALAAGATPAQCLERYPAYAKELRPLLAVADQLYDRWPVMSVGARARGRERIHCALDERPARFFGWLPLWEQAVAVVLIIASLTAAWLAWPGPNRKTTAPGTGATPLATAGPSLQPSLALPTASPPQGAAAPVLTPAPSAIAPRTATPAWTATATTAPSPTALPALSTSTLNSPAAPGTAAQSVPADKTHADRPAPQITATPAPTTTPTPAVSGPGQGPKPRATDTAETLKDEARAGPKSRTLAPKPTKEPKVSSSAAAVDPPKGTHKRATPNPPAAGQKPPPEPKTSPALAAAEPAKGALKPAAPGPKAPATEAGAGNPGGKSTTGEANRTGKPTPKR